MRVTQPRPQYCTECNAPDAIRVQWQNPGVVQNGGFALCDKHAEQLASILIQKVRQSREVKGRVAVQPARNVTRRVTSPSDTEAA